MLKSPPLPCLQHLAAAVRIRKYAGASALLTFEQFCLLMEFLKAAQGHSMQLVHDSQVACSCDDHGMASMSTMCCAPKEQKKKFTAVDQDRSQAAH